MTGPATTRQTVHITAVKSGERERERGEEREGEREREDEREDEREGENVSSIRLRNKTKAAPTCVNFIHLSKDVHRRGNRNHPVEPAELRRALLVGGGLERVTCGGV